MKAEAEEREIVTECELDAAPEAVWRALTEPELIGAWLLPLRGDAAAAAGAGLALSGAQEGLGERIDCTIAEWRPQEAVSYRWREHREDTRRAQESLVTFEIAPAPNGGTWLRIVHGALPRSARTTVMIAANANLPRALRHAA